MSGLHLASMEASDMLDVIHYIFEEDMRISTAEQAKAINDSRSLIYKNLYEKEYKYGQAVKTTNGQNSFSDFNDQIVPFTPSKSKPYIPPTEFDPDAGLPGLIEPALG